MVGYVKEEASSLSKHVKMLGKKQIAELEASKGNLPMPQTKPVMILGSQSLNSTEVSEMNVGRRRGDDRPEVRARAGGGLDRAPGRNSCHHRKGAYRCGRWTPDLRQASVL